MVDYQPIKYPWSAYKDRSYKPTEVVNNDLSGSRTKMEELNDSTTETVSMNEQEDLSPFRARKNSLIPKELMANSSAEGCREYAALATVFGVPEYVDSKIFWERQQYQTEELLQKLRPTSPTKISENKNQKGRSTQKLSQQQLQQQERRSSTLYFNSMTEGRNGTSTSYELQDRRFISSYVNSAFDPVRLDSLLETTFPNKDEPVPTSTISFALPKIPTVSNFGDFYYEETSIDNGDTHNSQITIPAKKPSTENFYTSCLTLLQQTSILDENNGEESSSTVSKERILIGIPEVFDFIHNDNDERFIIWGPDPISLSSSMATITVPERLSSYATVYNNQHNTRPALQGFSSNVTSVLSDEQESASHLQHIKKSEKNRLSTNSMRMSAQKWAKTLSRLSISSRARESHDKKALESQAQASLFLEKALSTIKFQDNPASNKRGSTYNIDCLNIPKVIEAASVYKLVEKLTNSLDYTFMTDFFLTYRDFLFPEDLCRLLILRFYWALQTDEESRKVVRVRSFIVFRHWLNNYFVHDFIGNQRLRILLVSFLNELPQHPLIHKSPRDQRIVKMLKRVVRRLKRLYYHQPISNSDKDARVKVIAPPPPTVEQIQIEDIVREKLSYQNVIHHKASFGASDKMKISASHHHGNMAIQDARYASVVIVGSLKVKGGSFIDSGVDTIGSQFGKPSFFNPQKLQGVNGNKIVESPLVGSNQPSSSLSYNHSNLIDNQSQEKGEETQYNTIGVQYDQKSDTDHSLLSDLTAGETLTRYDDNNSMGPDIGNLSDDEMDYEGIAKNDELEVHWLKEQQETIKFFHPSNQTTMHKNCISSLQADDTESHLTIAETDIPRPTGKLEPGNNSYEATAESPNINTAAVISVENLENISCSKSIRRVPSERWCKTGDDYLQNDEHKAIAGQCLPQELLKKLQLNEAENAVSSGISHGLAKKLSRKSIERRKSEKTILSTGSLNLNSEVASTTASVQSETSLAVHNQRPKVSSSITESRQLKSDKSRMKSLSRGLLKRKGNKIATKNRAANKYTKLFVSIPYEVKTEINPSSTTTMSPKEQKEKSSANISEKYDSNNRESVETKILPQTRRQQSENGQLLSLIAHRLRHNSFDDDGNIDTSSCACIDCISNNDDITCDTKRLSIFLLNDDERRYSVELRRKRATSVEIDQRIEKNQFNSSIHEGNEEETRVESDGSNTIKRGVCDDDSAMDLESAIHRELSIEQNDLLVEINSQNSHKQTTEQMYNTVNESITEHQKNLNDQTTQSCYSIPRPLLSTSSYHNNNSRSFIMDYKTNQLASQFCLIERDVLIKVGWEELIHCKWTQMDVDNKVNRNSTSGNNILPFSNEIEEHIPNFTVLTEKKRASDQGVEKVIQRFNFVCQWVSSEIVRTENINERVKLIEKFIRLAQKCKLYSNYATLVQILLGLQSPAVARLEKTWSKVSAKCQKRLEQLTEFTSPIRNWKNIRDSMTEVAEEYGNSPSEVQVEMPGTTSAKRKFKKSARIKIPFGGCIPFLGIYLSDLVFNSENPRFLKPNLENQKIYTTNSKVGLPPCLDQQLVNFRKYRVIATVIKRVLTFQNLAMRYAFDEDEVLLEKCRKLHVLDAVTIKELSVSLK
ncbi:hypothetical protein BDF20DRAFT_909611 [Mycotypha africana]|uniref:uncharacterized protein n=1 Tax=Mycotypha africana TaxID=64632 RepID=UPI002301C098|nr:uncharacterized protein BDF20DRAFT_909611 [Mycotypha africana]KAI8991900.1 hypothetical protein BDF20DRAFT_909611 [Mycotypha africana]